MQEEVTQRTVALCVEASKLSAGMLQQAMKKVLDEMQKGVTGHKTKLHHGKQTLRQLMKHNTSVSNIEIADQNIRAFSATAKKYGIDFALKKDTSGEIHRYLVFFKGRDADVITAAFREFSAINLEKEKKPSTPRKPTSFRGTAMPPSWTSESGIRTTNAAARALRSRRTRAEIFTQHSRQSMKRNNPFSAGNGAFGNGRPYFYGGR